MAGMEGRVVSLETGEDVNPGEEGEILLRGLTLGMTVPPPYLFMHQSRQDQNNLRQGSSSFSM